MNMNQNAKISLTALAMICLSTFVPVRVTAENNSRLVNNETQAAVDRLENLSFATGNTIKFIAPSVFENTEAYDYEVAAAEARLESLSASIESTIKFKAPSVVENAEAYDYEVAAAEARLENLNLAIEQSIKFIAPSVSEATTISVTECDDIAGRTEKMDPETQL